MVNHVTIQEGVLGRGNSKCKEPQTGTTLSHPRNSRAPVPEAEGMKKRGVRKECGEVGGTMSYRTLTFALSGMESH